MFVLLAPILLVVFGFFFSGLAAELNVIKRRLAALEGRAYSPGRESFIMPWPFDLLQERIENGLRRMSDV